MPTTSELKEQREPLKAKKQLLTQQLMHIKDRMHSGGRLPSSVWQDLQSQKNLFTRQIMDMDAQISALNTQIARQAELERYPQHEPAHAVMPISAGDKKSVIEAMVSLRQHYQDFAADTTRVRSKRDMAAEFVVKLSEIIRAGIVRPQ